MTARLPEDWHESHQVDLKKDLPGEIEEVRSVVYKETGAFGIYYPGKGNDWGLFVGDNGTKLTVHRNQVRGHGDAVSEFEEIMRSIEGTRRTPPLTN